MTDATSPLTLPTRGVRSTYAERRRWRGLHRLITASIGTVVIVASVYLGVTGPTTSPVSTVATSVVTAPVGPGDVRGAQR